MKSVLKIPKILWVTNIVLLVILGYIVVGLIFGGDREPSAIVDPISTTDGEKITPDKDTEQTDNPNIIIERNIFGSSGQNSEKGNTVSQRSC